MVGTQESDQLSGVLPKSSDQESHQRIAAGCDVNLTTWRRLLLHQSKRLVPGLNSTKRDQNSPEDTSTTPVAVPINDEQSVDGRAPDNLL